MSFFFIVVVTYCVKSKPHPGLLAGNELLVDTERDVRKQSKERMTGEKGESNYRWNSRQQVCRCRWGKKFQFVVRIQHDGRSRK